MQHTKVEVKKKRNPHKEFNKDLSALNQFSREEATFNNIYKNNIERVFDRIDSKEDKLIIEKLEYKATTKIKKALKSKFEPEVKNRCGSQKDVIR